MECLLIADDLTGACDAAVHFAMRGYRTAAALSSDLDSPHADVLAISTGSRDLDASAIASIMHGIAGRAGATPRILFKKIDSTLRGNAGAEIQAAMDAFSCDSAIVTPAFPALGRIVQKGVLRVVGDPRFRPINVLARLHGQGLHGRVLAPDAASDLDLDRIIALAGGGRVLWAGSGGLAAALARALPAGTAAPPTPQVRPGGVLFCVGSDHPVTLAQLERLTATPVSAESGRPEAVTESLKRGEHILLHIPRGRVPAARLRELIAGAPASGLLLCGGDTAAHVCHAIGASRIDLIDEIVPGLPRGILRGGALDGITAATKSGGFGDPDALLRVASNIHLRFC